MNDHTCHYCGGHLEEKQVTRLQKYEGKWFVIENLPALVCSQCGEQFFTPAAHDLVIQVLQNDLKPTRIENIPVFDAAKGA